MGASGAKKRPKPIRRKRQTSLTLDQAVWEGLKTVESKTKAKPSTVANWWLAERLKEEGITS